MTTKEMIAVMAHFDKGGEVEVKRHEQSLWLTANNPTWNWPFYDYRIKKPKEKKPLEVKDWAGGPWWIRTTTYSTVWMVIGVGSNSISTMSNTLRNDSMMTTWQRSKDLVNWEPCYKEE